MQPPKSCANCGVAAAQCVVSRGRWSITTADRPRAATRALAAAARIEIVSGNCDAGESRGKGDSERIFDARKDGDAFAAVADIDVADDERRGNGAKPDPAGDMEMTDRTVRHPGKDLPGIHEWRHL
jgi:hypothetical protein